MRTEIKLILVAMLFVSLSAYSEEKRPRFRYEEAWGKECQSIVSETPRLGRGFTTPVSLKTADPIEDYARWGLTCPEVWPVFELLVDADGNVRCVRILSYSKKQPPPGLYDEVRRNVLRWKFRPATRGGKPAAAVFNYVIHHKCG